MDTRARLLLIDAALEGSGAVERHGEDVVFAPVEPDPSDQPALATLGELTAPFPHLTIAAPGTKAAAWANLLRSLHQGGRLDIVDEPDPAARTLIVRPPLTRAQAALKRAVDVVGALAGLILLSPLLALVALAIRIDSTGPILFRQLRVGRDNRLFTVVKFRTMHAHLGDADGGRATALADDRVTRMGSFLRRTSLDELPQFLNILRGDMSLVGPRPHALATKIDGVRLWDIDPAYWQRHSVRPGLTGLAQVSGSRGTLHNPEELAARLAHDLAYARNWSLRGDLAIVLRSFGVLMHERAF